MVEKKFLKSIAAVVFCSGVLLFSSESKAAPITVDADITFVIDSSGSMGGEFNFLGSAIGGFLNDLQASPNIDTARAALVEYTGSATLVQNLTSDASALEAAFDSVSASGGTENAYGAVDAAIADLGISYRNADTVKSIVLITDEDADDVPGYSNTFSTSASTPQDDLLALVRSNDFLLNIIYDVGDPNQDAEFKPVAFDGDAGTGDAIFDIEGFRSNRELFFQQFTAAKIGEIEQQATTVPEPATLALLAAGLLTLALTSRYQRRASARLSDRCCSRANYLGGA